jgi:hypothetical protein
MQRLLTDMQNQPSAWAFARPVNKAEVSDYYDVIKNPMGAPVPHTTPWPTAERAQTSRRWKSDSKQIITKTCQAS